ncbi:MAG: DUF2851 family protein [Chitinophagales bacterium]|nr:DUF2851 family protein [Chitinophagales bacterium]
MKEAFIHFVWKYGLFDISNLTTTDGEAITIIHRGTHNFNQGADFQESKIKIGKNTFVGHVEIHLENSDWYAHGHQFDPNYNNTILHVVFEETIEQYVLTADNTSVPILCLKSKISAETLAQYQTLHLSRNEIPCAKIFIIPSTIQFNLFKERLVAERLMRKSAEIKQVLEQNKYDWELTFYWFLFASFGLKVNKEIFFQLAKSIPLKILAKHKNQRLQLEAIFYGQANMLNQPVDDYMESLRREYMHLAKLYSLIPPKASPLFLRLRPSSFPTLRISQFVDLVLHSSHLFSTIIRCESIQEMAALLNGQASKYWNNHYNFGQASLDISIKSLGKSTMHSIIINTILPFIFLYENENDEASEKPMNLLREIKAEKNAKIDMLISTLKIENAHALDSQALIELYDHYCTPKECLNCAIGFASLKSRKD